MQEQLDPRRIWWVPAVVAPRRDWAGMPGCHKGARYLIDAISFRPCRHNYAVFESRSDCLQWILLHRMELNRRAPDAPIAPADLARWLLGLD